MYYSIQIALCLEGNCSHLLMFSLTHPFGIDNVCIAVSTSYFVLSMVVFVIVTDMCWTNWKKQPTGCASSSKHTHSAYIIND